MQLFKIATDICLQNRHKKVESKRRDSKLSIGQLCVVCIQDTDSVKSDTTVDA